MNVEVIFLTFLLRSGVLVSFVGIMAISWLLHAALFSASPLVACKVASVTASGPSSRKAIAKARSPSVFGSRTVSRFDSSSKSCRSLPLMSFGCRSDIVDIFYHRNHAFPMVLCGFVPFEVFRRAWVYVGRQNPQKSASNYDGRSDGSSTHGLLPV